MFVEFLEVSYSNFLSYGAKTTTFKLKQGMNLITGTNGCGKCLSKETKIKVKIPDNLYDKYINTTNRTKRI